MDAQSAGSNPLPSPFRDNLVPLDLGGRSTSGDSSSLGHNEKAPLFDEPSSGPKRSAKSKEKIIQRASQACARCRRQKLRCLGGYPCDRCVKTRNECSFRSKESEADVKSVVVPHQPSVKSDAGTSSNDERSRRLESSVASLVAGLGDNLQHSANQQYSHLDLRADLSQRQLVPHQSTSVGPLLPPPTHTRPLDPPRIGVNLQSTVSPPAAFRAHGQLSTSPESNSLVNRTPTGSANLNTSVLTGTSDADKDGMQVAATESLYEAPFRSLMRQSRRNSPERDPRLRSPRFTYNTSIFHELDDPMNTDIVDESMAETLFQFFVDHCHPFLPIVNVSLEAAFITIRQSPPLFSAILAIASRFYINYSVRRSSTSLPSLDPTVPTRLANLAEAHLGHTLLRRHFALSDVQAILLLAAWSLPSGGGSGPDAWVVTGHAARVSRRLGVHKVLAQAAETARTTQQGSDEWHKLQAFIPQWRTWLSWFTFDGFLSLGFGRPQSTQFETVDESGFLQMRLHHMLPRPGSSESVSLYGDVYIAGQVQLTQIGRDLINWSEMLADPEKAIYADPRRANVFRDRDLSMKNMFKELNGRLEEWSKLWVWTDSPYALYLGPSARVARLQADHLRLCLNSYALKAGADEDEEIAKYLRMALNAATNTIQIHYESSQTDLGLSFATDYLTIALAQAAVFIIRITKSPLSVQTAVEIENPVLAHYLKMSIELLEASDMSETLLGTYLAKTIREIGKAAKTIIEEPAPVFDPNSQFSTNYFSSAADAGTINPDDDFNFEDFFQVQNELDLKYFLGLPSDGEGLVTDTSVLGGFNGNNGFSGEIGGLGVGTSNGNRWNAPLSLEALGTLLGSPLNGNH